MRAFWGHALKLLEQNGLSDRNFWADTMLKKLYECAECLLKHLQCLNQSMDFHSKIQFSFANYFCNQILQPQITTSDLYSMFIWIFPNSDVKISIQSKIYTKKWKVLWISGRHKRGSGWKWQCFVGVCGKLARFQSNRAYVLNHGSMYPQGSRGSSKIIKYILQGSGVHQWYLLTLKGSKKVFKDFLRHTEQKS